MTAYYNEIDPYAAQWLRNLIKQGLIADGEVDTRSIIDVRAADLVGFQQCHFFAGIGGWSRALRLAGWPDIRPVWTGSCPCQPFSLAGRQKGFDDERHLWPVWRELVRECRPATVFGEQVASAADWLGLVRGDLEAMGYAVGAMPIQAASAGADHLRDRYWFVAHGGYSAGETGQPRVDSSAQGAGEKNNDPSECGCIMADAEKPRQQACDGDLIRTVSQPNVRPSPCSGEPSGIGLADTDRAGSQGRQLLPERAGERVAGPDGLAHADVSGPGEGRQQRSGQFGGAGSDQEACDWVIGADGKARRVKPGIRLLAHGVPARVAKLRALGNAIVPQVAAEFIRATLMTGD